MVRLALCTTFAAVTAFGATAATVSETAAEFCTSQPGFCAGTTPFTLNLTVPTLATGDGTLSIEAVGDLNSTAEAFSVSVEGVDFGIFLNSNEADDLFDGVTGDMTSQYGPAVTGTAVFPLADLAPVIADGTVSVMFTPSSNAITDVGTGEYITATLSFPESAVVPLPAAGWLALLGLGGLAALRRRRA